MLEVKLANVGNPDFRQDHTRSLPGTESGTWMPCDTLADASAACRNYIAENDLGGGNWSGGEVRIAASGEVVAEISYNGRAWAPGSTRFGSGVERTEIALDHVFEDGAAPKP